MATKERWSKLGIMDKVKFVFELLGVFILPVYALFAGLQWYTMNRQLDQMHKQADLSNRQFQASERPYVTLGRADGKFMEFQPQNPKEGETSTVVIYVTNGGKSPALRFQFNEAFAMRSGEHRTGDTIVSLGRYVVLRDSPPGLKGTIMEVGTGVPLQGGATRKQALAGVRSTFSAEELRLIKSGAEALNINGRFEYCDQFGEYYCFQVSAWYQPAPVDDFVSAGLFRCELYFPPPSPIIPAEQSKALAPCANPQEQAEQKKMSDTWWFKNMAPKVPQTFRASAMTGKPGGAIVLGRPSGTSTPTEKK